VFIGETGFEPATARPPAREIRARPVLNARVDWGLLGLSATERTGRGRPRWDPCPREAARTPSLLRRRCRRARGAPRVAQLRGDDGVDRRPRRRGRGDGLRNSPTRFARPAPGPLRRHRATDPLRFVLPAGALAW